MAKIKYFEFVKLVSITFMGDDMFRNEEKQRFVGSKGVLRLFMSETLAPGSYYANYMPESDDEEDWGREVLRTTMGTVKKTQTKIELVTKNSIYVFRILHDLPQEEKEKLYANL